MKNMILSLIAICISQIAACSDIVIEDNNNPDAGCYCYDTSEINNYPVAYYPAACGLEVCIQHRVWICQNGHWLESPVIPQPGQMCSN